MALSSHNSIEAARDVLVRAASELARIREDKKQANCRHVEYRYGHVDSPSCDPCNERICTIKTCTNCGKEL